jgi:adenylate cyclase
MPAIHSLPDDRYVEVADGETILTASLRADIPHAHACGGKARCSTCRVLVLDGLEMCGPRTPPEERLTEELDFSENVRLACQTTVHGDLSIRRPVVDRVDMALANLLDRSQATERVGKERRLAILFADIAGYTPFAKSLMPYDVTHVLNRYFFLMAEVIQSHDGHISDYVGDGLMALFGIDGDDDHAAHAVRAGLGMFEALDELNPYLQTMYGREFNIRVGVHVGEVVVGTIGIAPMEKLAAMGDPVNFASRIEAANKKVGTRFLVSEDTVGQLDGSIQVGRSFELPIKGKSGTHTLYEVVGLSGSRADQST